MADPHFFDSGSSGEEDEEEGLLEELPPAVPAVLERRRTDVRWWRGLGADLGLHVGELQAGPPWDARLFSAARRRHLMRAGYCRFDRDAALPAFDAPFSQMRALMDRLRDQSIPQARPDVPRHSVAVAVAVAVAVLGGQLALCTPACPLSLRRRSIARICWFETQRRCSCSCSTSSGCSSTGCTACSPPCSVRGTCGSRTCGRGASTPTASRPAGARTARGSCQRTSTKAPHGPHSQSDALHPSTL